MGKPIANIWRQSMLFVFVELRTTTFKELWVPEKMSEPFGIPLRVNETHRLVRTLVEASFTELPAASLSPGLRKAPWVVERIE